MGDGAVDAALVASGPVGWAGLAAKTLMGAATAAPSSASGGSAALDARNWTVATSGSRANGGPNWLLIGGAALAALLVWKLAK